MGVNVLTERTTKSIHKLLYGNSVELIKDLPDESVDLILTDIPFNISRENNLKTMKDRTGRNGIDFGEWDKGFNESCLSKFVPKIRRGGELSCLLCL